MHMRAHMYVHMYIHHAALLSTAPAAAPLISSLVQGQEHHSHDVERVGLKAAPARSSASCSSGVRRWHVRSREHAVGGQTDTAAPAPPPAHREHTCDSHVS